MLGEVYAFTPDERSIVPPRDEEISISIHSEET